MFSRRVVLAYEPTLRWDDFADTLLGDFIVTHDFVRVFLVDTKTDNYKLGITQESGKFSYYVQIFQRFISRN